MEYTKGEQCSEKVYSNDRWGAFHPHQCNRKAVVERKGKPYCKIHDPEYTRAKDAKSLAKFTQEYAEGKAQQELESAATAACKKINPDNPLAVAESITELYEACKEVIETCDILASTEAEIPLTLGIALCGINQALAKAEGK